METRAPTRRIAPPTRRPTIDRPTRPITPTVPRCAFPPCDGDSDSGSRRITASPTRESDWTRFTSRPTSPPRPTFAPTVFVLPGKEAGSECKADEDCRDAKCVEASYEGRCGLKQIGDLCLECSACMSGYCQADGEFTSRCVSKNDQMNPCEVFDSSANLDRLEAKLFLDLDFGKSQHIFVTSVTVSTIQDAAASFMPNLGSPELKEVMKDMSPQEGQQNAFSLQVAVSNYDTGTKEESFKSGVTIKGAAVLGPILRSWLRTYFPDIARSNETSIQVSATVYQPMNVTSIRGSKRLQRNGPPEFSFSLRAQDFYLTPNLRLVAVNLKMKFSPTETSVRGQMDVEYNVQFDKHALLFRLEGSFKDLHGASAGKNETDLSLSGRLLNAWNPYSMPWLTITECNVTMSLHSKFENDWDVKRIALTNCSAIVLLNGKLSGRQTRITARASAEFDGLSGHYDLNFTATMSGSVAVLLDSMIHGVEDEQNQDACRRSGGEGINNETLCGKHGYGFLEDINITEAALNVSLSTRKGWLKISGSTYLTKPVGEIAEATRLAIPRLSPTSVLYAFKIFIPLKTASSVGTWYMEMSTTLKGYFITSNVEVQKLWLELRNITSFTRKIDVGAEINVYLTALHVLRFAVSGGYKGLTQKPPLKEFYIKGTLINDWQLDTKRGDIPPVFRVREGSGYFVFRTNGTHYITQRADIGCKVVFTGGWDRNLTQNQITEFQAEQNFDAFIHFEPQFKDFYITISGLGSSPRVGIVSNALSPNWDGHVIVLV